MNLNIEPTEEGRKLAADLANAEVDRVHKYGAYDFTSGPAWVAFARLATRFLQMEADMQTIHHVLSRLEWPACVNQAISIADKYYKPKPSLGDRITEYLSRGGLVNPELMDHEAVRDLLIECRAALASIIRNKDHG